MSWVNDRGVQRFVGHFPEPTDEELAPYAYTPPNKHGTVNGYTSHYARGERPCQECRDGFNRYRRERARKQRAGAA